MKKNIYLDYGFSSTPEEKLKLIKKIGFDGVFLFANDSFEEKYKLVKEYGLNVETIHLPFQKVCNLLWLDDEENIDKANEYVEMIKSWVIIASKHNIDKVVFHLSQSLNPPKISEIGFKRLRDILKVCEENNVYLALENLRFLEYLDKTLENVHSPNLICCFDTGHANCFTKNIETYDFEKYGKLIKCLHIHDNDGVNDDHLIPFWGNIDFRTLFHKLKKIGYDGELSLEIFKPLKDKSKVKNISEEQFLETAYKSICFIEAFFNE